MGSWQKLWDRTRKGSELWVSSQCGSWKVGQRESLSCSDLGLQHKLLVVLWIPHLGHTSASLGWGHCWGPLGCSSAEEEGD